MLYGSETWCLRENEMEILRRTEKAMVRAMCDAKLMEKIKENTGPNGDIGIEGNSDSDSKSEWSKMVQACVKEG